ncbi:MAG: hypothetical protein LQ340_007564, partial [Diploschistes diacapsis]
MDLRLELDLHIQIQIQPQPQLLVRPAVITALVLPTTLPLAATEQAADRLARLARHPAH